MLRGWGVGGAALEDVPAPTLLGYLHPNDARLQ